MTDTRYLETPGAALAYDVHGPLPAPDGRPPLMLVGAPMDASGFTSLVALFGDRTTVTYDPRDLGRSVRRDGRIEHSPEQNAADMHAVISDLGVGAVEMFASSGGAVSALALVTAQPDDLTVLVAHEPPLLRMLPDAERAIAAEAAVQAHFHKRGWGAGMAAFIALTMWQGELTDEYAARPFPDPAQFGLPGEDDGGREDPLLSGVSNAITAYAPDVSALRAAPTRIVVGVGAESEELLTGRTSTALATSLGQDAVVFPGGHAGFMGGEFGQQGDPEEFAAKLREVLRPA